MSESFNPEMFEKYGVASRTEHFENIAEIQKFGFKLLGVSKFRSFNWNLEALKFSLWIVIMFEGPLDCGDCKKGMDLNEMFSVNYTKSTSFVWLRVIMRSACEISEILQRILINVPTPSLPTADQNVLGEG